jgi:hypothetical protein
LIRQRNHRAELRRVGRSRSVATWIAARSASRCSRSRLGDRLSPAMTIAPLSLWLGQPWRWHTLWLAASSYQIIKRKSLSFAQLATRSQSFVICARVLGRPTGVLGPQNQRLARAHSPAQIVWWDRWVCIDQNRRWATRARQRCGYLRRLVSRRFLTRGIDPLLKDRRGLEHDDATGRDRYFVASSGITAHALAFLSHDKQAERRQLYLFATLQAVRDLFEHMINECRAFGSRKTADLLTYRLAQIRPSDRVARHDQLNITKQGDISATPI